MEWGVEVAWALALVHLASIVEQMGVGVVVGCFFVLVKGVGGSVEAVAAFTTCTHLTLDP